jgi:hypothetical protein
LLASLKATAAIIVQYELKRNSLLQSLSTMIIPGSPDKKLAAKWGWVVFAVGVMLPAVGWVYWMIRVGQSWWFAYRDGGPDHSSTGDAAERVRLGFFIIGTLLCIAAPIFAREPLRRKFLFSSLGAIAAVIVYYVAGLIIMYGFLGA